MSAEAEPSARPRLALALVLLLTWLRRFTVCTFWWNTRTMWQMPLLSLLLLLLQELLVYLSYDHRFPCTGR